MTHDLPSTLGDSSCFLNYFFIGPIMTFGFFFLNKYKLQKWFSFFILSSRAFCLLMSLMEDLSDDLMSMSEFWGKILEFG